MTENVEIMDEEMQIDSKSISVKDVLAGCLQRRVNENDFTIVLAEYLSSVEIEQRTVCRELLEAPYTSFIDPLHIAYIVAAIEKIPIVSLFHILQSARESKQNTELQSHLLKSLTFIVGQWNTKVSSLVAELLSVVTFYINDLVNGAGGVFNEPTSLSSNHYKASLADFVIALQKNDNIVQIYKSSISEDKRTTFLQSVNSLVQFLHGSNQVLADSLSESTARLTDGDKRRLAISAAPITTPVHNPIILWMEMLDKRPYFGSLEFEDRLDFLLKKQNSETVLSELTTSSLSCLFNAVIKQDQGKFALWQIFITNKLPLVFQARFQNIPSSTIERALRHPLLSADETALNLVNTAAGNDIDAMFSTSQVAPYDVRREFLKSLVHLGLIDAGAIDRILGAGLVNNEQIFDDQSLPVEEIVNSLLVDDSYETNLKFIIDEVEKSGLLKQVSSIEVLCLLLSKWCEQKETYKLQFLAQEIFLNTTLMNIILVYKDPYEILLPVITLLDGWVYEDEENFQENYIEFGSLFLLLSSFYYHFSLDVRQFQTNLSNSTCIRYLMSSGTAYPVEQLEQDQSDLLGGWIMALYDTNGISDELMRSCSPIEYVSIVPTIFQQSVSASNRNVLDVETLKGGLEYFLQPFLLPAVVGALHWLTNYIWTLRDFSVSLQIVHFFVLPPSISEQAEPFHRAILRICALPIYNAIQEIIPRLQSTPSVNVDVNDIINALMPHLQFRKGV
ncbi:mediator complex subunit Med5-domain-containing protein [Lipomyces japonicus]|uniref:mediator complex subunit Med5-domain-containing protein n=1 Tax=Lipomyces japonicus TaxID=56871 RepID=UPI0034D0150D